MALTKKQRQVVFDKSNGHCWYCGCELPVKGWHADHVEPVIRVTIDPGRGDSRFGEVPDSIKKLLANGGMEKPENDHIDNVVPACRKCNLFKGVFSVEEFRKEISYQVDRARDYSVNFRTAERFGLVEVVTKPVLFWFETQDS